MKATTAVLSLFSSLSISMAQTSPPGTPLVWYKGDAGLISSGSLISEWQDQAATRHLNRVIGDPSSVAATTTSGTSVEIARFDGNDALWIQGSDLRFSTDRSVVIYAKVNDTADGYLFDCTSTSNEEVTNPGLTRAQIRSNQWQVGLQAPTATDSASTVTTGVTTGTWQTHAFIYDRYLVSGSNHDFTVKHYIDGTLVGTHNATDDVVMQGLILGANVAGNRNLNVDIAEVLMYGLLSESEITDAHNYLSNKWGQVTEVDMTHTGGTTEQTAQSLLQKPGTYELAKLRIDTTGSPNPFKVTGLNFNLTGTTDTNNIASIKIYPGNATRNFSVTPAATITSGFDSTINVPLDHTLFAGQNYIWFAIETQGDLTQGDVFDATILDYTIDGAQAGTYTPTVTAPPETLTVGDGSFSTIVRKDGDDGVGNCRIPALVTTNNGTLIAAYDARWNGSMTSSPDLPANIDVAIQRSLDGGLTWQPMQIIMDYDVNVAGSQGNGVGDPSLLVDRSNGRIWCAALWSKGNNAWHGSGPGLTEDETGQFVVNYSDDDGATWSAPVSITSQIKDPSWNLYFNGPGKGFSTREGHLVFPAQYRDSGGTPRSNFIYSTDNGTTWHTSAPAIPSGNPWTTESQMVELDNGDLLITMRNHHSSKKRLWCIYSWDHETETIADGSWGTPWYALDDPTVMGSIQRYTSTLDGHSQSILLFSNPASTTGREKMTIYASLDEGLTWPYSRKIDDRLAAYSCLTVLPDGDIGIFYETGATSSIAHMEFLRFPLTWVVGDADSDFDGMTDFYEDTNGLDKNSNLDAALDSDGDGLSNLEEFYANTSATDASSKFETISVSQTATETSVSWQSVPNKLYTIEESSTLANDSWTPVENFIDVPSTSTSTSVNIPKSSDSKKFYRVKTK